MGKQFYFKQFNLACHLFAHNLNIKQFYLIDKTLSDASTTGQSGPRSNGSGGVLHIPHNSSITGASPSDFVVSSPENLLVMEMSCSSVEMQSLYSTSPANWVLVCVCIYIYIYICVCVCVWYFKKKNNKDVNKCF